MAVPGLSAANAECGNARNAHAATAAADASATARLTLRANEAILIERVTIPYSFNLCVFRF